MEWIFDRAGIGAVAAAWWKAVGDHRIFAFQGAMGAGKTTFIHHLCLAAGVKDPVSSPTYALVNEYAGRAGVIYHMDLYRLRDEGEARDAGIEDCLDSGAYCFVEWPEKAPGLFPENVVQVRLEVLSDGKRKLTLQLP